MESAVTPVAFDSKRFISIFCSPLEYPVYKKIIQLISKLVSSFLAFFFCLFVLLNPEKTTFNFSVLKYLSRFHLADFCDVFFDCTESWSDWSP